MNWIRQYVALQGAQRFHGSETRGQKREREREKERERETEREREREKEREREREKERRKKKDKTNRAKQRNNTTKTHPSQPIFGCNPSKPTQTKERQEQGQNGSTRSQQRDGYRNGYTTHGGNDHTPTHHKHARHHNRTPRKERTEKRRIGYTLIPGSNTTAKTTANANSSKTKTKTKTSTIRRRRPPPHGQTH